MANKATGSAPPSPAKKSKGAAASKKPGVKATHPPTSSMVNSAIKSLNERGGSSLQAIKKYISATYKIDAEKVSPFIKKYLKTAVTGGKLVQTKGRGASGSFKLAAAKSESAQKKVAAPKKFKEKPVAKSVEKVKAAVPAKAAKAAKDPEEKSTKTKAAAKVTKTPKPKKASPAKKAAPKKAAAPKKK